MSTGSEELIARVRQGDSQALGEFLVARRYQLLAYITRQLGAGLKKKVEPEDIFQEASAEAVRSLKDIDLSARDPFGWLCQIAERRIIDAHRRFFAAQKRDSGREVSLGSPAGGSSAGSLIDLLVASMTTASQVFSRNQRQHQLLLALAQLPEDQREALRLRYVEGLPTKQIAEKLGKTDGALRVMLSRSLNKLQELLGPDASPT